MCGIAGIVSDFKDINSKILLMLHDLNKRGPDSQDYKFFKNNVVLGHSRLSIIDLDSRSNQPMISSSRRNAITFNGEIYNYKDLKKNYFNQFPFKTSGDTEVLLEGIEKYGFNFIKKIRGFFSFCYYNINDNKIYLFRDELGKKPLYYYHKKKNFYFSSNLHSLVKIINKENLNINNDGLGNYFWKGYFSNNHTIYEDIKSLQPGAILEYDINLNTKNIKKILNNLVFDNKNQVSISMNNIKNQIQDAIDIRKTADVDIAYMLSGGIDSSLVCQMASTNSENKINTFYAKFQKKKNLFDSVSNNLAEIIGSNHSIINIDDVNLDQMLKINYDIFHEPFADYSSIPSYLTYKEISKKFKVVITGDGADEFFAGYVDYKLFFLKNLIKLNIGTNFANSLVNNLLNINILPKKIIYLISIFILSDSQMYNLLFNGGWNLTCRKKYMLRDVFNNSFSHKIENDEEKKFKESGNNPFERSLNSFLNRLKDDFNVKVDRTSMFNSLEARSPFLDTNLFSFISKRKLTDLIKNFETKSELKEILKLYNLHFLTKHKKEGFTLPLLEYMLDKKNQDLLNSLTDSSCIISSYFEQKKIKKLLSSKKEISKNFYRIWILLVFDKWHRETSKNS